MSLETTVSFQSVLHTGPHDPALGRTQTILSWGPKEQSCWKDITIDWF
jgi:hypothetical protein